MFFSFNWIQFSMLKFSSHLYINISFYFRQSKLYETREKKPITWRVYARENKVINLMAINFNFLIFDSFPSRPFSQYFSSLPNCVRTASFLSSVVLIILLEKVNMKVAWKKKSREKVYTKGFPHGRKEKEIPVVSI